MYFSKIEPGLGIADLDRLDPYRIHQFLWEFFADDPMAKRQFLYRHDAPRGRSVFYVVSMHPPGRKPGWRVAVKEYTPKIGGGEHLWFSLRVNAVVSRSGKRHDVVMDLKKSKAHESGDLNLADLVQRAGFEWLDRRTDQVGFQVDPAHLRVSAYRQHRFRKRRKADDPAPPPARLRTKRERGSHEIAINSIDLEGRLTVTDADRFHEVLFNGVGPAKSFGCGLLLVRR